MNLNPARHNSKEAVLSKYLINSLDNAAFCLEADGRLIYANDATCRLLEYSRQELLSMTLQDIILDFSLETWSEQWEKIAQQGLSSFQCRLRTKSDRALPVEIAIVYVEEPDSKFGCALIRELKQEILEPQVIKETDRSDNGRERAKTETELATPLSLLRSTFDSTACGIIAVSFEGEVTNYNRKFLELWQIPESKLLSNDPEGCRSFFASKLKNPEIFRQSVWEISRESAVETCDVLELKDGRMFVQYSRPQRLGEKIIGRVWSIWDLTEFRQQTSSETDSDRALEEEKFKELKARFFSVLCHQFRSFLNIISFSNSLLRRGVDRGIEKKIPYFDNIQTAVEQITTLLDRLIFLGQSEVGRLKCEPQQTEALERLCRDLVAQLKSISDSKEQTIEFISQGNCGSACVDLELLQHILMNLLSNAVKYTPNGGKIAFKLFCRAEKLIFQIQDGGIGIPESDRQRIFEPFYRGSNIDELPGNGLGLAIVKNLVDIYGGRIQVESEVGVGTTFTVFVPSNPSSSLR
jgi:PAS domain S-box-containing protein